MKKVVVLLLLMVSTNVFAEWSKLGDSSDKESTVYVDFETIKRKGNKVKMSYLLDFKSVKTIGNISFLSSVFYTEFDCEEETGRLIDASLYLRNMLMGGVVDSMSNMKNEPTSIQPLTTEQLLFKIACYKK